jgi:hypothetical protein
MRLPRVGWFSTRRVRNGDTDGAGGSVMLARLSQVRPRFGLLPVEGHSGPQRGQARRGARRAHGAVYSKGDIIRAAPWPSDALVNCLECTHTHTHPATNTHTYTHACVRACMVETHAHARTHTHTHARAHAHAVQIVIHVRTYLCTY